MPEPHSTRLPASDRGDGRSARTRAGDGLPPRFYDPARGRGEPAAVTAARERHLAVNDQIQAARDALDAQEARDE